MIQSRQSASLKNLFIQCIHSLMCNSILFLYIYISVLNVSGSIIVN